MRYGAALWLVAVCGCTGANPGHVRLDLSAGGGDLSTGDGDLPSGADDLPSGAGDLPSSDGDGSADGGDLASNPGGDGGDASNPPGDMAAPDLADGALAPDLVHGGCGAYTGTASAGFFSTDLSSAGLTVTVPGGYHLRGQLALVDALPGGASLDAADSTVRLIDAQGRRYDAAVTAAGSALAYDVVLPEGTYSLAWQYVISFAGGIFLTRLGQASASVCGDGALDVAVPSFGALTATSISVGNLAAFGLTGGYYDLVVELRTLDSTLTVLAGRLDNAAGAPPPVVSAFVPSGALVPAVQVTGKTTTLAPLFATRVGFLEVLGGQPSYALTIPPLSTMAGAISDPQAQLDPSALASFHCDSTDGSPFPELAVAYLGGTSSYKTFYRTNGSCVPYFDYPIKLATPAGANENGDALLFAPDPTRTPAVAVEAALPSPFPSPSPSPVPKLTAATVFGQLADAAGAPLAGWKITARSSSLAAPAPPGDVVALGAFPPAPVQVTTDASGHFELHLPSGSYDLAARR